MSAGLFPLRPNQCLELARARNAAMSHDDLVREVARLRIVNRELAEANKALAAAAALLTGDSHE